MTFRRLLLPVFLLGLILTNIKAILVFIFHPLLKHRFFSLSLFSLIIYLAIFAQALLIRQTPTTVRLSNYDQDLNALSITDFNKFPILKKNLLSLEQQTGGTTLLYLNLALIAHYQGQAEEFEFFQSQARRLDPNHQIFR